VADVTAALVKELREKSGVGMMDCKRALVEAEGDLERAVDLLRERGLGKARSKADRATSEGCIVASVSADAKHAALIEVNCETDFVARTDDFGELCKELAGLVRDESPADLAAFLGLPHPDGKVSDRLANAVLKLGENIKVSRVERLDAEDGLIGSYIHAGGKIGVLAHLTGESGDPLKAFTHNVCMHVAASNPLGVSRGDIAADEVERERGVLRRQAESEGKPAAVVEKMVEGRLTKFFKELVLLEQPLVMDPDRSVGDAARDAGAEVVAFRRYQLGEEAQE
jgi:elongation factor Ts